MDPRIGRFISMDEWQGMLVQPLTMHGYLFAGSNPVMFVDPTGYNDMSVGGVLTNFKLLAILSRAATVSIVFHGTVAVINFTLALILTQAIVNNWEDFLLGSPDDSSVIEFISNITMSMINAVIANATQTTQLPNNNEPRDYVVYKVFEISTNNVVYVGRTRDFERRQRHHQIGENPRFPLADFRIEIRVSALTRREARALEQLFITLHSSDALRNARNEIAQKNLPGFANELRRMRLLILGW